MTENTSQQEAPTTQAEATRARRTPRWAARPSDDGLALTFDLPGASRGELELAIEEGELHLLARTTLAVPAPAASARLEFEPFDFEGRWALPEDVDADAAEARLEDGRLTVTIPGRGPQRRAIEVR